MKNNITFYIKIKIRFSYLDSKNHIFPKWSIKTQVSNKFWKEEFVPQNMERLPEVDRNEKTKRWAMNWHYSVAKKACCTCLTTFCSDN